MPDSVFFLGRSNEELQADIVAEFCGGSASKPRGFVSQRVSLHRSNGENLTQSCDNDSVVIEDKDNSSAECTDGDDRGKLKV